MAKLLVIEQSGPKLIEPKNWVKNLQWVYGSYLDEESANKAFETIKAKWDERN